MSRFILLIILFTSLIPATHAQGDTVHVLLQEWRLLTDVKTVNAGQVHFQVRNGGRETHEMVILKTDQPYDRLPQQIEGGINEDVSGEVVDEIEDIVAGSDRHLSVMLKPGNYVILCNMVEMEDGQREEHYGMGMRAPLVVK